MLLLAARCLRIIKYSKKPRKVKLIKILEPPACATPESSRLVSDESERAARRARATPEASARRATNNKILDLIGIIIK